MADQAGSSVQQEIVEAVRAKYEEFRAMSRDELAKIYEGYAGQEAHPRVELDIMAKACARFYQNELWHERVGYLPDDLIERDMQFWLSNEIFFVRKEDIKQEKARAVQVSPFTPRKKAKASVPQGTGLGRKTLNVFDARIRVLEDHPQMPDDVLNEVIEWLKEPKQGGEVDFEVLAKFVKKKRYKMNTEMIIFGLKRNEGIILVDPNPEPEPAPEPEGVEEEDDEPSVEFDSVIDELTADDDQEKVVDPGAVDFGGEDTSERFT